MQYFVIRSSDNLFWTGKDWTASFLVGAKQYKSRGIAENAVQRTVSRMNFDKKKTVVEVVNGQLAGGA